MQLLDFAVASLDYPVADLMVLTEIQVADCFDDLHFFLNMHLVHLSLGLGDLDF